VIEEHRPFVVFAVVISVFQDRDAVVARVVVSPGRIGEILNDPEPAAIVEREGDRLGDGRFGGEAGGSEARRQLKRGGGFVGGKWFVGRGGSRLLAAGARGVRAERQKNGGQKDAGEGLRAHGRGGAGGIWLAGS